MKIAGERFDRRKPLQGGFGIALLQNDQGGCGFKRLSDPAVLFPCPQLIEQRFGFRVSVCRTFFQSPPRRTIGSRVGKPKARQGRFKG